MGFSRSARIITLLVIDTVFFILEITVGIAVHSLALVADSFHMLNDIFSLIVALWAIKLAKQKTNCNNYTYGWQRAEILGALINGVFLIALCVSIFLEAIQRLIDPPDITNPWLILWVGSAGLASNIVGLFLFHDHGHGGHSHGHDEHDHDHGITDLEGQRRNASPDQRNPATDSGSIDDVLPRTIVERASRVARDRRGSFGSRFGSSVAAIAEAGEDEVTPLLKRTDSNPTVSGGTFSPPLGSNQVRGRSESQVIHMQHHHMVQKPADGSDSHGHSHGNLNMRGVFLHVLGDALGNIGVIATALFIIYSTSPNKFYADPIISLVITVIIFSSALPLCRSASKILLQAVPQNIHLQEVRDDLSTIPGVEDVHELHIWQLSDTKLVASVHVRVSVDTEADRVPGLTERYVRIDKAIRTCLHAYGIHSSTIQQEFVSKNPENTPRNVPAATGGAAGVAGEVRVFRRDTGEVLLPGGACLLDCGEDCEGGRCCPGIPGTRSPSNRSPGTRTPEEGAVLTGDGGGAGSGNGV